MTNQKPKTKTRHMPNESHGVWFYLFSECRTLCNQTQCKTVGALKQADQFLRRSTWMTCWTQQTPKMKPVAEFMKSQKFTRLQVPDM